MQSILVRLAIGMSLAEIEVTRGSLAFSPDLAKILSSFHWQRSRDRRTDMGVKKTGKGRRKVGRKKRRMRARIRHRK